MPQEKKRDGDERLRPWGGSDSVARGLFWIDHAGSRRTIDTNYFDFDERIHLYRDGELVETQKSPAKFQIDPQTTIEAEISTFGMKHVRMRAAGIEEPIDLQPGEHTGEAWRAEMDKKYPRASRTVAATSWIIVFVAAVTQIPEPLNIPLRAIDVELPTLDLPRWANISLAVAGVLAGIDRALRLTHDPLMDE
jgi:hypothetical protein